MYEQEEDNLQEEQSVGIQGHIKKSKSLAVNHYLAAANYTPC